MRALILTLLFSYTLLSHAQELPNQEVANSDSLSLRQAIETIEQTTDLRFYFLDHWLEDIYVNRFNPGEKSLEEQLDALLLSTSLDYYIHKGKVILLQETSLVSEPAISQYLTRKDTEEWTDTEIVLSQDRQARSQAKEEVLHVIGLRSRYQPDSRSTVAGYIKDGQSGEPVEGAFVYIQSPYLGTSTDAQGFYSLTIPNGNHTLLIQSVNMKNTSRQLKIYSDGRLDMDLEVDVIALNAVVVSADREVNVQSPKMGMTKIDPESLKIVPALLGEKDMIRVSTTTAGVQFLGEGSAGINIRGGKADQNLFLLDGTPIYNTNHFFGFFSVLNNDALSGVDLHKSSIPAEFGGRLSSVFDVKTKKPNADKFSGTGGIGPVTSRLTLEAPITKKGPSLLLGGRATYSDYVLNKIKNSPLKNNQAAFYDLVGKLHYDLNEKNELSFSSYYSFDRFQLASDTLLSYTDFSYANTIFSLNWKHVFNDKLQGNFQLGSSNYDYDIGYDVLASQAFGIDFAVRERLASAKLDRYFSERLNLKFGAEAKLLEVQPGKKSPLGNESLVAPDEVSRESGREFALFAATTFSPSEKFTLDMGIRYGIYSAIGPADVRLYAQDAPRDINFQTGWRTYGNGERITSYHGPEPRFAARYTLSSSSSVKGGYSRTRQNMHLLINAASIAPTDIWRLSGTYLKPQIADQWSVGYYKNFYGKHTIEASLETYYKSIQNLVDFKVGADLQFNQAIETDLLQGNGRAYGAEFSIKKSSGWLTGWINYTYSRSLIQLDGQFPDEVINDGEYFPTGYDKPHYLNSVTNYKFTRRLTMTLGVVYATGVPVTYPVGKWSFKSSDNLLYSDRNAFRIPDYFRLDLGINIEGSHKIKKLAHSSWNFSIYNVLGRDNVYSVFFKVEEGAVRGYQLTVFSNPIPTLTYNFKF